MSGKYTDVEKLLATQIGYLDFNVDGGRDAPVNVYEYMQAQEEAIRNKPNPTAREQAQLKTIENIKKLTEQHNYDGWKDWKIVDSCNHNSTTGMCANVIDTGDGNAMISFRGSESFDLQSGVMDWGVSDVGLLNSALTVEQADATAYMEYIYSLYGDKYNYTTTGHSLGGNLAQHALITAPEGMKEHITEAVSYDGPGYSDEYIAAHKDQIEECSDKLKRYKWSWVSSLLNPLPGETDITVQAEEHDSGSGIPKILYRHSTENVMIDEYGNIIPADDQDWLSKILGPISRDIEGIIQWANPLWWLNPSITLPGAHLIIAGLKEIGKAIETVWNWAKNTFFGGPSDHFEVNLSALREASEKLDRNADEIQDILDEIEDIRTSLRYDSAAGYYYKARLSMLGNSIDRDRSHFMKISEAVETSAWRYENADQNAEGAFI